MGPGAQHGNGQHHPPCLRHSLVVFVGVELAIPQVRVSQLAEQHKGSCLCTLQHTVRSPPSTWPP